MPKKKPSKLLAFKPASSAHPSLLPKSPPSTHTSGDRSVNEILSQLRRSQVSPASVHQESDSSISTTTSLPSPQAARPQGVHQHPISARLVNHADHAALTPRQQMARRRAARPPPGPRPPPSWTNQTRNPNDRTASYLTGNEAIQTQRPNKGALPGINAYARGSLRQMCLVDLARLWPSLETDEIEIISGALSAPLREHLLLLLASDAVEIGQRTLRTLVIGSSSGTPIQRQHVLESWEDVDDVALMPVKRLTLRSWIHMRIQDFGFLTGLSLAHSTNHDWNHLFSALQHLPHLTHLDLSHWTLALLATDAPPAAMGPGLPATNRNQYLDQSARLSSEASRVLRRIGAALGSLRWLCLEGCEDWVCLSISYGLGQEHPTSHLANDDSWESLEASGLQPASQGEADASPRLRPRPSSWPHHFPHLHTLRLSPSDNERLLQQGVLRSQEAFEAAVEEHRPPRAHLLAHYSFPPRSPDFPLRVLEASGHASRLYEGPQFVVRSRPTGSVHSSDGVLGLDAGTRPTTYTLQPARQVPLWNELTTWLNAQRQLKSFERHLARMRAPLGMQAISVERAGVDDGEGWIRDLLWRWSNEFQLKGS